jgi:2-dehydro-3-deoxyphosphogluconate aldolase/(4S)-4-hydroxy-2-oxoglutarate aldolase
MATLAEVTTHKIVPVLVVDDVVPPGDLAEALIEGGLPIVEVTLRTPPALAAIRAMAERTDLLVGAGTVRTPEAVDRAVDAGARFVVSPGLRSDVVERAFEHGVLVLPGCVTPSEIMAAERFGLSAVKFFPAEQYGGRATLAALSGPFPNVRFVPTGGVSQDNLHDYLTLPAVAAVGGSWMVAPAARGDLDEVVRRCRAAASKAQEIQE